ncbi:RNA polymerase II associated protein 1 [Thoreauomyces humboldtii]|nr:RNA polymerase II associated protein 1 [Thoreauomyces humboldtii]
MSYRGIPRPSAHDDEEALLAQNASFSTAPPSIPAATTTRSKPTAIPTPPATASRIAVPSVAALQARGPGVTLTDHDDEEDGDEAGGTSSFVETAPKKRSLFAERRAKMMPKDVDSASGGDQRSGGGRKRPIIESADAGLDRILSDIVEKDTASVAPPPVPSLTPTGFPAVQHRSDRNQQPGRSRHAVDTRTPGQVFGEASLAGDSDVVTEEKGVHDENVRAIEGMSKSEIEEAQREILEKLDPALVAMLRTRAAKKYSDVVQAPVSDPSDGSAMEVARSSEPSNEEYQDSENGEEVPANSELNPRVVFAEDESVASHRPKRPQPPPWIPPAQHEYEKLEWTSDLLETEPTGTEEGDFSAIRFDFSAAIVRPTDTEIPHHHGLHHHGADPAKAGYTLDEVLSLSRSTSPPQRALALKILAGIAGNVHEGTYGTVTGRGVALQMVRKNALLNLRVALDDTSGSGLACAIEGIAAILGTGRLTGDEEEILWERAELGRTGHRTFEASVASVEMFRIRATGLGAPYEEEAEDDGTLEAVISLLRRDAVLGLLRTNVLTRFSYLIGPARLLPLQCVLDIVHTLVRIARHSRETAEEIAECQGLVQLIHARFLRATWPASEEDGSARIVTMRLIIVLCRASRDVAESLVRIGVAHDVFRYIIVPATTETAWTLQTQAWKALTVLFMYGLSAAVVDEYRSSLFEAARALFATGGGRTDHADLQRNARIAFLRMFAVLLRSFGEMLDVGGPDDAAGPFVEVIVNHVSNPSLGNDDAYESAVYDVLAEYGKRFVDEGKAASYAERVRQLVVQRTTGGIGRTRMMWLVQLTTSADRAVKGLVSALPIHFLGLQDKPRVEAANALVLLSHGLDYLSSILELVTMFHATSKTWSPLSLQMVTNLTPIARHVLEHDIATSRGDWIRCFVTGKAKVATAFLAAPHRSSDSIVVDCALAMKGLASLLPGDEAAAGRLLNLYILHNRVQDKIASEIGEAPPQLAAVTDSQEDPIATARLHVQDMLDRSLYGEKSLILSEGIHGRNKRIPETLLMSCTCGMPCRPDWMYAVLDGMVGAAIVHPDATSDIEIVLESLRIIERLDRTGCLKGVSPGTKIVRSANTFLLPGSSTGQEPFSDPRVSVLLESTLARCCDASTASLDLTSAFPSASSLLRFFTRLVEQFAAISYGDPTFARYVLCFLHVDDVEVRRVFWTELYDLLPCFSVAPPDSKGGGRDDDEDEEKDELVLGKMVGAVREGKVTETGTPWLWNRVRKAVTRLLKRVETGGGEAWERKFADMARKVLDEDFMADLDVRSP